MGNCKTAIAIELRRLGCLRLSDVEDATRIYHGTAAVRPGLRVSDLPIRDGRVYMG